VIDEVVTKPPEQPRCTIQQLQPFDTLAMCAAGGLAAMLFLLGGLAVFRFADALGRFRERRVAALQDGLRARQKEGWKGG
jgi:hypothetical protein